MLLPEPLRQLELELELEPQLEQQQQGLQRMLLVWPQASSRQVWAVQEALLLRQH